MVMTKAELNIEIDMDVFNQACQNILDNWDAPALSYAVAGAKTGVRATEKHTAYNLSLRLVGNMTAWRGEIATMTRRVLKRVIHQWSNEPDHGETARFMRGL